MRYLDTDVDRIHEDRLKPLCMHRLTTLQNALLLKIPHTTFCYNLKDVYINNYSDIKSCIYYIWTWLVPAHQ